MTFHLWLNADTALWVQKRCFEDGLAGPQASWSEVTWRVCPSCCFVELQYRSNRCPRPRGEYNGRCGPFSGQNVYDPCTVETVPLPPEVNDALWAALRVGGTNAVREVLLQTRPEDVGLLSARDFIRERARARRDRPG